MEQQDFITMFLMSLAALYPVLFLFAWLQTSRKRLEARGYSEEYIAFLRSDRRRRLLSIAIALPLLEIAAALIVILFTGPLQSEAQLLYVLLVFIVLVAPFPIRDRLVTQRRLKELAVEGKERIVADLNFALLHRIFRPSWELAVTVLYAAFMLSVRPAFHLSFIHLGILWLLYFAVRGTKNATRPALREAYMWTWGFMLLNHLILLFHLADTLRCCGALMSQLQVISAVALLLVIAGKAVYYFMQIPGLRRELSAPAEV